MNFKIFLLSISLLYLSCTATYEGPKIFGIGLSKTGTTSLAKAFDLLRLKNIHHDKALVPFLHRVGDYEFAGKYDHIDAVSDIPTAYYYKEFNEVYPDAKFILTIRDVDGWYTSFLAHLKRMDVKWGGGVPLRIQELHKTVYGSLEPNETLWKQRYNDHFQRVIDTIPQERLLIMNIVDNQDGWEKLCPFLGITNGPCASDSPIPFPHANSKFTDEDRKRWIETHPQCIPKATGSPIKYAYTFLLADAALSSSRDYLIAALVLTQSLKNVNTTADVVAMIFGPISDEDLGLLSTFGVKIVTVAPVGGLISHDPGPFTARTGMIYRAKIRAWELTEYDRIIFVDLDGMFVENADHLFQLTKFTALVGGNSPFNAGFFVATPNCQAFIDMNDIARSDSYTPEKGWFEYGPFPHWKYPGQTSDWSFYASQAEQGIIWYYYGCHKKDGVFHHAQYFDDVFFHFIGVHKPWLVRPHEIDVKLVKRFREPTRFWFQTYEQVKNILKELYKQKGKTLPSLSLSEQTVEDYGPDPYCEDCKVSQWGPWTNCSVECGGGIQYRNRTITQEPTCNNTCPSLSENRTCNPSPCEKFECSRGNCLCVNIVNQTDAPSIQSQPAVPTVDGCGSAHNFTINPIWGWDEVCNESQICYSTCNTNKSGCDRAFQEGLVSACHNLPQGTQQQICLNTSKLFASMDHLNASSLEFISNQTTHCSCLSSFKQFTKWTDNVSNSFDEFLKEFCEARVFYFRDLEDCERKAMSILLEKHMQQTKLRK